MLINELVIQNLSQIYFVYQKSVKGTFKPGFWVQNHPMNLYSRVEDSQKLICSKKNWCEIFILKISGIQIQGVHCEML